MPPQAVRTPITQLHPVVKKKTDTLLPPSTFSHGPYYDSKNLYQCTTLTGAMSLWTSVATETVHSPLQRKPKEPNAFKKMVGNYSFKLFTVFVFPSLRCSYSVCYFLLIIGGMFVEKTAEPGWSRAESGSAHFIAANTRTSIFCKLLITEPDRTSS